jgi:hypothetical protein
MQFVVKVSFEILNSLSINHLFFMGWLWIFSFSFLRFLAFVSFFLLFCIHGLIELYIFSQILQSFFDFLNSCNSDIMFSIGLSIVLFDDFWSRIDKVSQPIDVKVFIDEHVINLFDFLLKFINKLVMFFLQFLQLVSRLAFESWKLWLSYKTLQRILQFGQFIV